MNKAISKSMNKAIDAVRNEAKEFYQYNKKMYEVLKGRANKSNVNMFKVLATIDAGIYNKDYNMYIKAYNKIGDTMLEILEYMSENNENEMIAIKPKTNEDGVDVAENEQAYIEAANNFKQEKEKLERRHQFLMMINYFNI